MENQQFNKHFPDIYKISITKLLTYYILRQKHKLQKHKDARNGIIKSEKQLTEEEIKELWYSEEVLAKSTYMNGIPCIFSSWTVFKVF